MRWRHWWDVRCPEWQRRPTLPPELPEVEQAGSVLEIAAVRSGDLGDDCDNNNKLTLCDTDNGSTWPESHGGDTFTVKLKFSEEILVHPLVMRYSVFRVRNGRITSARAVDGTEVPVYLDGYKRVRADEVGAEGQAASGLRCPPVLSRSAHAPIAVRSVPANGL